MGMWGLKIFRNSLKDRSIHPEQTPDNNRSFSALSHPSMQKGKDMNNYFDKIGHKNQLICIQKNIKSVTIFG